MAWAHCPICSAFLSEARVSRGSRIQCPGCGSELEIVSVGPFDAVMGVVSPNVSAVGMVGRSDDVGGEHAPRHVL